MAKVIGKGISQVGKMDAILTDAYLGTRIKICLLMNVIVPNLGMQEKYGKDTLNSINNWKQFR